MDGRTRSRGFGPVELEGTFARVSRGGDAHSERVATRSRALHRFRSRSPLRGEDQAAPQGKAERGGSALADRLGNAEALVPFGHALGAARRSRP